MKHITLIAAMVLALSTPAFATENEGKDWKEKMMSERIAYMTVELGITPEEAQVFWPVYNEVQKEKDEAMHRVFVSFRKLEDALKTGKSEKEISDLLDNYHKALKDQIEAEERTIEKFKKTLPAEKLAKLYIVEENFRRKQIRTLTHPKGKPRK